MLPPLPPPSSPPAGRRRVRLVLIAAAVAALALAGVAVLGGGSSESPSIEAGDCVVRVAVQSPLGGAPVSATPVERISCSDPSAAYRVAIQVDGAQAGCPSAIYRVYREAVGPAGVRTLCLTYNVGEGECFVESPEAAGRYDCGLGPRPDAIRILRVVAGVADITRCDDLDEPGRIAVTVPEPATTFCYVTFLPGSPGDVVRNA